MIKRFSLLIIEFAGTLTKSVCRNNTQTGPIIAHVGTYMFSLIMCFSFILNNVFLFYFEQLFIK